MGKFGKEKSKYAGSRVANPMNAALMDVGMPEEAPPDGEDSSEEEEQLQSPTSEQYELVKFGTLDKKADLSTLWHARYVELRGPWLSYWQSEAKKVKKGQVHVGGATVRKDLAGDRPVFTIVSVDQHQHIHSFRLPKRAAGDGAEEAESSEFEQWLHALKNAAAKYEKISMDGVVDISHLHDVEQQESSKHGGKVDADKLSWCLVFRVDHSVAGEIPVEALEVARNLTAAHLYVEDRLSKDHARLFLLVGAREEDMIEEATKFCHVDMRLKDIQGTHRFHRDLYASGYFAPPVHGDGQSAFTSAQRQILTKNMMERLAGEDLEKRLNVPNRTKHLKHVRKGVLADKPQHTWRVEKVLGLYGASRPTSREDLPICFELMQQVQGDLTGLIDPVQHRWDLLESAIEEMVRYDAEDNQHFNGHMISYFPLHCDAELQPLIERWSTFAVFKTLFVQEKALVAKDVCYHQVEPSRHLACLYQPLDEIRDYFGEPTALYFALAGMYCRSMAYPAVMSIFAEALHRLRIYPSWVLDKGHLAEDGSNSNFYTLPYSIFLALWSILVLEMWKRREWELKFIWGSEGFEKDEKPRATFEGVPEENLLTGAVTLVYGNTKGRVCKVILSLLLTFALMGFNALLLFQAIMLQQKHNRIQEASMLMTQNVTANSTDLSYMYDLNSTEYIVPDHTGINFLDQNYYAILAGLLNLFIIVGFGGLYDRLASKLTDWENHRTQTEWDDALTVKSFMFQFVNNYFTLFYIALLRQFGSINPFGPAQPCQKSSCLAELTTQLAIIFCGKIFLKKIADTTRPFIKKYVGLHLAHLKVKMHMKHVDRVRALILLDDGDQLEKERQRELEQFQRLVNEEDEGFEITDPFELQERKPPSESLFDNFSDLAIEFGYLSFFSPAFPLASVAAFFANMVDLRTDSIAICRGTRRVPWQHAEDIGCWYQVLNSISFIAVITNAVILGFVSTQMAGQGTVEQDNIENRFRSYTIWIGVIAFEHVVVLLKILLGVAMPDQPRWIDSSKEKLLYYRKNKLLTVKQQKARAKLVKEQDKAKKAANEANIKLLSQPEQNTRLDPKNKTKRKKKKAKDPNVPENRFGGGRVGKLRGVATPNPMQDMVLATTDSEEDEATDSEAED